MKIKKLEIIIFLLTLMPIINIGNTSAISAQNWGTENNPWQLPDLEVSGKEKVTCDCCHGTFDDDDAFNNHIAHSYACQIYYGNGSEGEENEDDLRGTCCFCHKPSNECTCNGAVCPGNKGGNSSGNTQPNIPNPTRPSTPSTPATAKSKVSMTQLVSNFKASKYDRTYDPALCGFCLKGWKTIWQKSGIGEYASTIYAKNFGEKLLEYGFKVICSGRGNKRPDGYTPQVGDTRVWESYYKQDPPAGHIDWWDGTNWVSDYRQGNKWRPGPKYEYYNVPFKIYR